MRLANGDSIQAHWRGNWTRFVNHSSTPNVRFEEWSSLPQLGEDGRLIGFGSRVVMITNIAVAPGTELLADYNKFHVNEWPKQGTHSQPRRATTTSQ